MFVPRQLTILTTSMCTTKCAHCCVSSSPQRRDRLSYNDIKRAIDGVREHGQLTTIVFAGGEPTLLGETLLDGIAYAHALGLNTRVITNASWAITDAKAESKIVELREAGLQEINLSTDDFHEPDIPFVNVQRAWLKCHDRGFVSVVINVSWGPKSRITPDTVKERLNVNLPVVNHLDRPTKHGKLRAADGTLYVIHSSFLQLLGRARVELEQDQAAPVLPEQVDAPCPFAVRSPALSPKNHLVACCGIEAEGNQVLDFGSADESSITSLFARADDSIAMQVITRLGPKYLMEYLRSRDPSLPFRNDYRSICEVCEHVTTMPAAVRVLRHYSTDLADTLLTEIVAASRSLADQTAPASP